MWLRKSVLSRALASPKKQFKLLSVSSLTRKKKSTHILHITVYIVLTSMIKNIPTQDLWSCLRRRQPRSVKSPKRKSRTDTPRDIRDNSNRHKYANNISTCSLLLLMKITYMHNVNRPMLLSFYEKCINSLKTH
ncbi:hypothetical protein IGI04_035005 [Brassica rapa subsp. trilocularis]|uniref:Uncharacterized protein n=1 Tax=Brassica rapa subsp. trilocularis TaxID=1813537 RepID=A0ABQ7LAD6_BRACM|nr:hypothetical protein IGI04_035005 [Brassica rapa subsp. trilocularis]